MKSVYLFFLCLLISCQKMPQKENQFTGKKGEVKLITLAPGHFHAALLQKNSLDIIDPVVHVYAPEGKETESHLQYINSYNSREIEPTHWKEIVYTGDDFLEKMWNDKKGNVVVLAGNNQHKTDYIFQSVENNINVLADKPMAIDFPSFEKLEKAFYLAKEKDVIVYDLMTERYVDYNIVNRVLMQNKELFGELIKGDPEQPAVELGSVHHFFKEVSGKPLIRPAWYYDVNQQGEGLTDVTTHLIDLVFWKCFPDKSINYKKDIRIIDALHWPTTLTREQFQRSTGEKSFPDYMSPTKESTIEVYSNGSMLYTIQDMYVAISVVWNYQAPPNTGDTHSSVFRGSKSTISILQGEEQSYIPKLYIERNADIPEDDFYAVLKKATEELKPRFDIEIIPLSDQRMELNIRPAVKTSHEDHFSMVAKKYFDFLVNRDMPQWETDNMLAKYYITTKALDIARRK